MQKGFDILLQAFAKLKDSHPEWILTIFGEGKLRSELESLRNQLGLFNRVHFPRVVKNPYQFLLQGDMFIINKWLFYQFLLEQKIPVPETTLIENVAQINSLNFNFPIILKPLSLGGGTGVQKFDSIEEVSKYLSINNTANRLPLLAQEYIPGFDIIFSILAKNGEIIAWTIHKRTPYFLEFFKNDSILDIGKKIVSYYNYSGIANFDIRFDERNNSVKVIECNPRFWASLGASVYYGVDFVSLGILLAQNNKLPENLKKEVTSTEKIPYPWPDQFLRGLTLGQYPFQSMNKISKDLAWQSLLDPLPNLYQKVWKRLGVVHMHDGVMLEKL